MSFADIALPLLDRGLSVTPVKANTKTPILGAKVSTRDKAKVEQWAASWPEANVGVVADQDTIILDVDDVAAYRAALGPLPDTYTVQSSPGKAHVYFKRPQWTVKNMGFDWGSLRADTYFCVGAGSIHPNGHVYAVIKDRPIADLNHGLFREWEHQAAERTRKVNEFIAKWDGQSTIPAGMRHDFLKHWCAIHWQGQPIEEFEEQAVAACREYCENPEEKVGKARELARWYDDKEPYNPGAKVVLGSVEAIGQPPERKGLIVLPSDSRGRNGWFPIGQVSTIVGSSSAGKTKLTLQMIDAMRRGVPFLQERELRPCFDSILWIQQDRGLEALHDSLDDLGLPHDLFPTVPPLDEIDVPAVEKINKLLSEHGHPTLLIVDGLDILFPDTRGAAIKRVFKPLQRVAANNHCAIIGLWGSPKRQSTKDAYSEVRHAATGSADVGRMSATAALLTIPKEDENARNLKVNTHRSRDDRYTLMFDEDSRLVPADPIALAKQRVGASRDVFEILQAHGLDWRDVKGALEKGVSESTWYRKKR